MRAPQFFQFDIAAPQAVASEVHSGLVAPAARVSPKFFYDALGSHLFDAITELDEYYPTRTEAAIVRAHQVEIGAAVHRQLGSAPTMVDLGAGNCAKAASLFDVLRPARYLALDISVAFLQQALNLLQQRHPQIEMTGVGLDFSRRLALPPGLLGGPALLFYPGSSIGNFSPEEALQLLQQAQALCGGGALLIGVDLVKPVDVLQAAYDDALGVTAAFNLNLLRHLNRLIGSDFDPRQWRHVALFNTAASRIEMHLEARTALTVRWRGGERRFGAGERVHTENSYKWEAAEFKSLLRDAGYPRVQAWLDPRGWYALMLAHAR